MIDAAEDRRAGELFAEQVEQSQTDTGRLFLWLFMIQWVFAIVAAGTLSPYAWVGSNRSVHVHLQLALLGGLALHRECWLSLFPNHPSSPSTACSC